MGSGDETPEEPPPGQENNPSPSLSDLAERVNRRRAQKRRSWTDSEASPQSRDPTAVSAPEQPIGAFGSDPKTEAIIELIGDASNLLLLGPLHTPADHDLCTRLATALSDGTDRLLLVTTSDSPDERLAVYQGYLNRLPDQTTILSLGDSTRSPSSETIHVESGGSITIDTIADPTDLMRIGITISKIISEWAETGHQTAICFHSLSSLIQFATDPQAVFRFIHVLGGRLQSTGVHAHFHMDPTAHDEKTISMFRPLFDEVLLFAEDGTLHIDH